MKIGIVCDPFVYYIKWNESHSNHQNICIYLESFHRHTFSGWAIESF